MSTFILILALFLGVLSVVNKVLLLRNQSSGWTSGMAIGLVSSVFFFLIGLKILAFAELGFFFVMLYGSLAKEKRSNLHALAVNVVLTCATTVLAIALFTGELTVYQVISSFSFIWGGYALAVSRRLLGWLLLLAAHIATAYASEMAGQVIFAGLQVLSALVCIIALIGLRNRGGTQKAHATP